MSNSVYKNYQIHMSAFEVESERLAALMEPFLRMGGPDQSGSLQITLNTRSSSLRGLYHWSCM